MQEWSQNCLQYRKWSLPTWESNEAQYYSPRKRKEFRCVQFLNSDELHSQKIYPMHTCSASLDNFDDVWAINSLITISFISTVTLSYKDKCHRRSLGENLSDVCPKEIHKPLWFADKNVTEYHDHSGSKKNHSCTNGASYCEWMGLTLPLSYGVAPEPAPAPLQVPLWQWEWHQWKLSLQLAAGHMGHHCYTHSTTCSPWLLGVLWYKLHLTPWAELGVHSSSFRPQRKPPTHYPTALHMSEVKNQTTNCLKSQEDDILKYWGSVERQKAKVIISTCNC